MNQKVLNKVFIWGFLFLYLLVAAISFCHAIEFFNIGNVQWMSVALAFSFELGLALSLAAILLSDSNKSNTLPWILMITLCVIQVIGNVYSVFKYISLSETDYYLYLQKSLLFWIEDLSIDTVQVIISWIMGAILPIVALMMTEMVASNIKNESTIKEDDNTKVVESEKNNVVKANSRFESKHEENDNNIEKTPAQNIVETSIIEDTPKTLESIADTAIQNIDNSEDDNIENYIDVLDNTQPEEEQFINHSQIKRFSKN